MGQISKYGLLAAAIVASFGSAMAADQDVGTLPTPRFFVEIVGPDGQGATVVPESSAKESPPPAAPRAAERRYGPIDASHTLWSIANQVRPNSRITVYQAMLALYDKNPEAFKDGNINLLLDGFYLVVPSATEMQALTPKAAAQRFFSMQQGSGSAPAAAPVIKPEQAATVAKLQGKPPQKPQADSQLPAAHKPNPATVMPAAPEPASGTPDSTSPASTKPASMVAALATQSDPEQLSAQPAEIPVASSTDQDTAALLARRQLADLEQLAKQLSDSSEQFTSMAEANHRLKLRLQELADEVATLRASLEDERASQAKLLTSLQQQQQQLERSSAATAGEGWLAQLGQPLTLISAAVAGVLGLLLALLLWLRRRHGNDASQAAEQAPLTFDNDQGKDRFDQLLTVEEGSPEPEPESQPKVKPQSEEEPQPVDELLLDESLFDKLADGEEPVADSKVQVGWDKPESPEAIDIAPPVATDDAIDIAPPATADKAVTQADREEDEDRERSLDWSPMEKSEQDQASDSEDDTSFELDDQDLADAWAEMLAEQGDADDNGVQDEALEAASADFDLSKTAVEDDLPDSGAESSETEKRLRESLRQKADTSDQDAVPGTLEQQFIDNAPESEVDELFAAFGKEAFSESDDVDLDDQDGDAGFIDINKLLSEADDTPHGKDHEPYQGLRLNMGLGDFPEVVPANSGGVDVDADGASAKLDLARAYLEIDDSESAKLLITEVIAEGNDKLKLEAQKLIKRLG